MVMARLSGPQIAAAMALAKMTQDQLAEAAGLGRNTLNRTINDTAETKDETLTSIRRALEARGIEFLSDEGVKRHFGTVDRMEGDDALHRFFDDVYDTVKDGGDLCVSGADERSFAKFNINDEAAQHHRARMSAIKDKIKFRVLLKEGDTYYRNTSYIEYRWIQKKFFFEHPIYLYNNKLAFIKFDKSNLEILRIDMPSMATAFRLQFDFMWNHSIVPPPHKEDT
jgi:transcriptional regulator with XRE-family HTH domain